VSGPAGITPVDAAQPNNSIEKINAVMSSMTLIYLYLSSNKILEDSIPPNNYTTNFPKDNPISPPSSAGYPGNKYYFLLKSFSIKISKRENG